MEVLRVVSGDAAGEEISLADDLMLGRDETGPGALGGDAELSRRHAHIHRGADGRLTIEDLGSTNGTRVNGQLISEPHLLREGDRVEVGMTKLVFVGDPRATAVRRSGETRIAATPPVPPVAADPAPAAVPAPAPAPAQAPAPPPEFAHPAVDRKPPRRRRTFLLAGAAVILIAAAAIVVWQVTSNDNGSGGGGATVASDCGANLGGGQSVGYVAYVESNVAKPNANSVIAMPYSAGDLAPLTASQCPTDGAGSTDLTDSGVLDADNQVLLNKDHTLLFAVNQGSDTIAVFHVASDGALTPVDGSPFPSGGMAPASLGLSGSTLVVANKAQDGVRDLSNVAPNYTSFKVGDDGTLTQVSGSNVTAKPGSSPTDAYVPPEGGVAFSTEESGPLRGMDIGQNGVLTQGSNSPLDPDPQIFGSGFNPDKIFGLGIAALPRTHGLYIGMPTVPAVAVYVYSDSGALRFVNSVPVNGAYLPCWIVVTPNARWMYTANATTGNIVAFDVGTDPATPRQIQTFAFDQPGNPWNEALSPDARYLFVNTPRDTLAVPEGEGNLQHVLKIGPDGKLSEVSGSPAKIPVPAGTNPQGVAVLKVSG
jgi:6-phosphogluconolactonase (cycloisomerase 2 family)